MAMHGEDYGTKVTMAAYRAGLGRSPERRQELLQVIEAYEKSDLERAEAALEAMDGLRLSNRGGYPSIITSKVRGYVIVADPGDENGVMLTIYRNRKLVAWYHRALDWLTEEPDEDIVTAMYETAEEGDEL